MQPTDVVIIGGGISGVAAAYELAGAGASVTLVEKGDLASMASGWTLAGVRQSGRDPAEIPLAVAAVKRWEQLAEALEADVEYRQDGNLRLARTEDEVPVIARLVDEGRSLGLPMEYLDGNDDVRRLAPALAPSILAASYCPTDGHANPLKVVRAFAEAAKRRGVTVSTVGLVPAITKLAAEDIPVTFALSLHAPDDQLRDELIPVNSRWKVDEALDAARGYFEKTGRRVSIEYALIKDMNDHAWRADLLAEKLNARGRGWVHVNPIPLNPTPGSIWTASEVSVQDEFVRRLNAAGIPTTLRDTRGKEIDGACGQLVATEDDQRAAAQA